MKINGVDGVDAALWRLATLERRQLRAKAGAEARMAAIKERLSRLLKPLKAEFKRLRGQLERWTLTHQDELQERTLRLTHGAVRLYKTPPAIVSDLSDEEIVARLRKHGLTDFIRVKEEPDRAAMRALDDADLAKVGCRRESRDEFQWQLAGETEWR
jgi:phage host-nuclease inhibitor protein Gam